MDTFNKGQKDVLNAWLNTNDNIFCSGQGGTGKSYLLNEIVNQTRQSKPDIEIVVTAPTGTAAFNVKGMTIHRFAGIGIETEDLGRMIQLASKSRNADKWRSLDILVIDEVSMISATFFENLSYVAQSLRDSDKPFGGIRLLIFGDFLQLPPIVRGSNRPLRAFECDVWKECEMKYFFLSESVRQVDKEFISMLNNIRIGICDTETEAYFKKLSRSIDYQDEIEPVKLFSRKDSADSYNLQKLSTIESSTKIFTSSDRGNIALLNHCIAPQQLELKIGAQVMLTRNLSSTLVNGSVGTVKGFNSLKGVVFPVVDIISAGQERIETVLTTCSWESFGSRGELLSKRTQIPLILAWAVTIHKSQGSTIPRLYLDMSGIFECGQAYVGLSRAQSADNLQVVNFNKAYIKADFECIKFYSDNEECTDNVTEIDNILPASAVENTHVTWAQDTADNRFMRGEGILQSTMEALETLQFSSEE